MICRWEGLRPDLHSMHVGQVGGAASLSACGRGCFMLCTLHVGGAGIRTAGGWGWIWKMQVGGADVDGDYFSGACNATAHKHQMHDSLKLQF